MPLNATPDVTGNVILGEDPRFAIVAAKEDLERMRRAQPERVYRSHFASCPAAAEHRKPKQLEPPA